MDPPSTAHTPKRMTRTIRKTVERPTSPVSPRRRFNGPRASCDAPPTRPVPSPTGSPPCAGAGPPPRTLAATGPLVPHFSPAVPSRNGYRPNRAEPLRIAKIGWSASASALRSCGGGLEPHLLELASDPVADGGQVARSDALALGEAGRLGGEEVGLEFRGERSGAGQHGPVRVEVGVDLVQHVHVPRLQGAAGLRDQRGGP